MKDKLVSINLSSNTISTNIVFQKDQMKIIYCQIRHIVYYLHNCNGNGESGSTLTQYKLMIFWQYTFGSSFIIII